MPKQLTKRLLKWLLIPSFIVLGLFGLGFHYYRNFHTVIPQAVYRSGQLSEPQLAKIIHRNHIRSILNLRGEWRSNDWYQAEWRLANEHHLYLYNLKMEAHGLPELKQLRCLAEILNSAPKPILIHCRRGADRTGLASAVAMLLHNETDLEKIRQQISWRYFAIAHDSVGKMVLPRYQRWLTQHKLTTGRASFETWLHQLKAGTNYPLSQDEKQYKQKYPRDFEIVNADFCPRIMHFAKLPVTIPSQQH